MRYIEPHGHMVSRTTDDYEAMVSAGCQAVCEPAFWAGFDRGSVEGFRDYFRQLTVYEPARAAKFLLPHYCWLCLNPKESEDLRLARAAGSTDRAGASRLRRKGVLVQQRPPPPRLRDLPALRSGRR